MRLVELLLPRDRATSNMQNRQGSDATPNIVVNAALTYLTPLQKRLQSPPPGAEHFASDIGLAVGNFLQWIQPHFGTPDANSYNALFQGILSEARLQSEAHKFPVRLSGLDDGRIVITVSVARTDGRSPRPITLHLEDGQ